MTLDEMLAVLQAAKEGRTVQIFIGNTWCDALSPEWNFGKSTYRVKPEPREWWIVDDVLFKYKTDAEICSRKKPIIHVREVIE